MQAYAESNAYQRVFTALTPEELKLVLQQGWEALSVSPVFSPDAGPYAEFVLFSLYSVKFLLVYVSEFISMCLR